MATELYHNKLQDSALDAGHRGAKSGVQYSASSVRSEGATPSSLKGQKSKTQRQKKGSNDAKSTPTSNQSTWSHIGKNGKLTPAERQQREKANLGEQNILR